MTRGEGRGTRGEGRGAGTIFALLPFPHLRIRVGLAGDTVEPAVEVVTQRARAQYAETVFLPKVINLDDDVAHVSWERADGRADRGEAMSNAKEESEEGREKTQHLRLAGFRGAEEASHQLPSANCLLAEFDGFRRQLRIVILDHVSQRTDLRG